MEFSKKEIIITSWSVTKTNLSILLITATIYLFLIMLLFQIFSLMSPEFSENIMSDNVVGILNLSLPPIKNILFLLASIFFITGLNLGFLQICINLFQKKQATTVQLFNSFDVLLPYLFSTILYVIAQLIVAAPGIIALFIFFSFNLSGPFYVLGICLAFFPAVYCSIRLQFYVYFLLDQNKGCIEALKDSFDISNGFVYQLFIIGAILSLIIQISIIPFFIGLIIALPYSKMVTTYTYIKLFNKN